MSLIARVKIEGQMGVSGRGGGSHAVPYSNEEEAAAVREKRTSVAQQAVNDFLAAEVKRKEVERAQAQQGQGT